MVFRYSASNWETLVSFLAARIFASFASSSNVIVIFFFMSTSVLHKNHVTQDSCKCQFPRVGFCCNHHSGGQIDHLELDNPFQTRFDMPCGIAGVYHQGGLFHDGLVVECRVVRHNNDAVISA